VSGFADLPTPGRVVLADPPVGHGYDTADPNALYDADGYPTERYFVMASDVDEDAAHHDDEADR